MFGVGCGFVGTTTISSGLTAFNISIGLAPITMVSSDTGTAFYWLSRKANKLRRTGDIPAA